MNTFSRHHLYAHGEPFGDCATRPKLIGKGYICGGGGGSSSSQSTANIDRRIAVQDGIGISGDSNALELISNTTTNIQNLDGGAIKGAFDFSRATSGDAFNFAKGAFDFSRATSGDAFKLTGQTVSRALDSIDTNNATLGEGYNSLLSAAESLWERGEKLIGQTQQSVADAYTRAQDTAKGTIDNRTIIVLAVAGAAAVFLATRGRK